jgi:hypothetical protein
MIVEKDCRHLDMTAGDLKLRANSPRSANGPNWRQSFPTGPSREL